MATQAQAPQSIPVQYLTGQGNLDDGALYGLPGVTVWSEQKENNAATVTNLQTGAQTPANFPANMKQTDVVYAWRMRLNATQTLTGGTFSALSPYFPYNIMGPVSLNMQNQFDTISYLNGVDAAIFQAIRPQKQPSWVANMVDQNVISNAYSTPAFTPTLTNFTQASANVFFDVDLLPGIWFDLYYDLEENGMLMNTKAQGVRSFVSPQMMAGTNRVIQPRVTFNQIYTTAGNGDISPYEYTVAPSPATISAQLDFRRKITYQPQSSKDAPLLWNWQYSRQCIRGTIGAITQFSVPLPLVGQILSFYIRMWDPGSGTFGAPINNSNVTEADVQIGSGLYRFQDTEEDMRSRFYRQHGMNVPVNGCLVWDLATDDQGRITNSQAINTLTTSGPTVTVTLANAPSASAYYVLGYEALRYVALQ